MKESERQEGIIIVSVVSAITVWILIAIVLSRGLIFIGFSTTPSWIVAVLAGGVSSWFYFSHFLKDNL